MKTLIAYKSKYGTTEKYMKWLADDLGAEMKRFDEVNRAFDFSAYDLIIVSSGTYAGFMPLNRFLKRFWKTLQDKNVLAVAVGAALAEDSWSKRSYNKIPEKIRSQIKYIKILGEMPSKARPADYESCVKRENLDGVLKLVGK
jgi:menaquinone-dependent protoporphyrinogen IX oxidase